MPISEQFRDQDAPEWSWGDPSQVAIAQEPGTTTLTAEEPADASAEDAVVGRPWLDVLMGMVFFLIGQLIIGLLAVVVYLMVSGKPLMAAAIANPDTVAVTLIPVSLATIAMVIGWSFVGNRRPKTFLSWGFKPVDVLWGLGTVVISVVVGVVLAALFQVPPEESAQLNSALWPADISPTQALWAGLAIGILVPIAEEMVFRGMIQNALSRWFNHWVALPVTALIFALPHLPNFLFLQVSSAAMWSGIIQVAILGLVIGAILIKTGRLGGCILAHIFNNSMVVLTLVYTTFMA